MYEGPGYRSKHSHFRDRHYGATRYVTSKSKRELGTLESTDAKPTLPTSKKTRSTPNGPVIARSWPKPKKRPVPITPAIWCELYIIHRSSLYLQYVAHTETL